MPTCLYVTVLATPADCSAKSKRYAARLMRRGMLSRPQAWTTWDCRSSSTAFLKSSWRSRVWRGKRSGIELLNVRYAGDRTHATVFVPAGKLDHFEHVIHDYLDERRDSAGRSRDNRKLIDAIRRIRAASLRALWTDADTEFPTEAEGALWWEVWLPVRGDRQAVVTSFRERAAAQGMRVAPGDLIFPERTVLLVSASLEQMRRSMLTLNSIAELRRAKETAEFFDSLQPEEQHEWLGRASMRRRETRRRRGLVAGKGATPTG